MVKNESWIKIINLLAELTVFNLFTFEQFLEKLIKLILKIVPVSSCLIYFFDREENKLILIASKKPHANLMGKIMMQKGEGITGWVAEHGRPVILSKKAYADKRFKSFEDLPEDRYEAFLSMPIINKDGVVGVINLQHKEPYSFDKEQVKGLESIVKIIAAGFEKIVLERRIGKLESKLEERKTVEKAKGVLMKKKKMSEHAAYEMIREEAMKKRKSMKEIAEAILLVY